MYKCLECGEVFEEPYYWSESRGEFWGFPCSEEVSGCPHCKGDYEEVEECGVCGEYFFADELHGGVCRGCIKEQADFNICYKIGADNPENVKINGFLMSFFTVSEIESILKDILIEKGLNDCSEYINGDLEWFGEEFLKEVNKNE